MRLRISNGCTDTQISAEHSGFLGNSFVNPNAPSDKACNIFHPNGGNISPLKLVFGGNNPHNWGQNGLYFSTPKIRNVGIDATPDLTMTYSFQSEAVCREINNAVNIGYDTPFKTGWVHSSWQGTYIDSGYNPDSAYTNPAQSSFCHTYTGDTTTHVFRHVILAR